jgi:hypothetical protein
MLNVTQTGVVMSKTVKRVTTVMMIGLVALLGAQAEAHTRWVNGKPRTCSHCGHGTLSLTDVLEKNLVAEYLVTTKEVRIECANSDIVTLKDKNTATLVARTLSTDPKWVNFDGKTAEVEFFDHLGELGETDELFANLGFCSKQAGLVDAKILKMSGRFEVSACLPDTDNPCRARVLLSTMQLNDCKLDAKDETYVCGEVITRHVHPTPAQ